MDDQITTRVVADATGLGHNAAWKRLRKYWAGLISREELFAPPQLTGVGRKSEPSRPLINAIMARTGISRAGALARLRIVETEDIPRQLLFATTAEIRAWRRGNRERQYAPPTAGDWRDLGLGPRRRIQDIPGGTAWERTHLGR